VELLEISYEFLVYRLYEVGIVKMKYGSIEHTSCVHVQCSVTRSQETRGESPHTCFYSLHNSVIQGFEDLPLSQKLLSALTTYHI
jgi:hypothetical protein